MLVWARAMLVWARAISALLNNKTKARFRHLTIIEGSLLPWRKTPAARESFRTEVPDVLSAYTLNGVRASPAGIYS